MQGILSPYLWLFCLVYIDDIVVYSKSYEDHLVHLDKVLSAIIRAGITLSPKKCHFFYASILLLGHKVSRLGLSTHAEKVAAVKELVSPKKTSELYTFLGMAVYFAAFIPYFSDMAIPLFDLLKKNQRWIWEDEHEYAFVAIKNALAESPVLAHPQEGLPYRLYTDASDYALGCALQQIQTMQVGDLKGTKVYDRILKAHTLGKPVPKLFANLTEDDEKRVPGEWRIPVDDSSIQVERVIAYYSRRFKPAETRYSTTEREALGAKEGLVRFQPFIEGAAVALITDHNALQWDRTYENSNRRLAAWASIFSAYAPLLRIIHRPGRKHSNVDPLSRLVRPPPEQYSPAKPDVSVIPRLETREGVPQNAYLDHVPAVKFAALATLLEPVVGDSSLNDGGGLRSKKQTSSSEEPARSEDSIDESYWLAELPPPTVTIAADESLVREWASLTQNDPEFGSVYNQACSWEEWRKGDRFLKDTIGLLYFRDADFQPRLCVPRAKRTELLTLLHEDPMETAHMGIEKLWPKLTHRWYWKRMKIDAEAFCGSCDVCQKIKNRNFTRWGLLTSSPIPSRPFESISWDLITGLPKVDGCDAILVVVCRLGKMGIFEATQTKLKEDGFAELIVRRVFTKFGLPDSIFCDRDPKWVNKFWTEVAKHLRTRMVLSTTHHPQHDGQTEIVNKTLETMLQAFVSVERDKWKAHLHLMEFAYNGHESKSTTYTPFRITLGYEPKTPAAFLIPDSKDKRGKARFSIHGKANSFLEDMQRTWDHARDSIAKAQHYQAKYYNRRRRAPPDIQVGSRVLVNPHSLEWIESKGKGVKLVDRWIGPFEVVEVITPMTYRLKMPGNKYKGGPNFNLEHLKPYIESPDQFGPRTIQPPSELRPDEEKEVELERIVKHRETRRGVNYWVKWKGFSEDHNEWLPENKLKNAYEDLRAYKKANGIN